MRTLRIHLSLTAYPPSTGGAQIHAHQLAKALRARGHAVGVTAFWDRNRTDWLLGTTLRAPSTPDWEFEGLKVQRPRMDRLRRLAHLPFLPLHYPLPLLTTPVLARLLRPALEATIPHEAGLIHHVRIGREVLAQASLDIARKRGIPFVLTPLHHPRWTGWRYGAWLRIYREADLVFALTATESSILADLGVDPARIRIIGHAPCLPTDPGQPPPSPERPTILFLGQHYTYKGWRELLQAAPLVWNDHPDTRFVFAGPDVGDSAEAFRGLDPRIERLGLVDEQRKVELLQGCTMLVLPSMQESFGGVFTEAWHFGKPVIGCPIPAVSELIQDGRNGLLRTQAPAALAEGILQLLGDPKEAQRMGEAGRQLVRERFNWESIAARAEEGYAWALANRRP